MENQLTYKSPSRNVGFQHINGLDGELAEGDGCLTNTTKSFPFRVNVPVGESLHKVSTDISNWLKKDSLWHNLIFSAEDQYIYQAIYQDEYDLERMMAWRGRCELKFAIKPYKFLKTGLTTVTSPTSLTNPTVRDAKPLITLKGTGNITLNIGSEKLTLKGVDGGVIVDCQKQMVTNLAGTGIAWDKVTSYPLPVIKPGKQTILTTGTVAELTITPRWEVIV